MHLLLVSATYKVGYDEKRNRSVRQICSTKILRRPIQMGWSGLKFGIVGSIQARHGSTPKRLGLDDAPYRAWIATSSPSRPHLSLTSSLHPLFASCPHHRLHPDLTSSFVPRGNVDGYASAKEEGCPAAWKREAALLCAACRRQRLRARDRGGRCHHSPRPRQPSSFPAPIPPYSGLSSPCAATPSPASSQIRLDLRHPR